MKKKIISMFLAFCMVLTFSTPALTISTFADTVVYAKSQDGKTEYTSIDSAWEAVEKGVTVVMQHDWTTSDRLVLDDDETGTIYMNGYKIERHLSNKSSDGEVIYLDDDSKLTLRGCNSNGINKTESTFKVNNLEEVGTFKSGGLVTGGWSTNGAGGIHMKDESKLILDNVAVSGNKASDDYGGGVNMNNSGCSLTLKNGAFVSYNYAKYGGGVYAASSNCTITMSDASKIEHNYSIKDGGGIYSNGSHTTVNMTGGSSICHNTAKVRGGGYFAGYSYGTIKSSDKTGEISYNTAGKYGGAIYIEQAKFHSNENSISGIIFTGNTAVGGGGALYLCQEDTTVSDCVMTGNSTTATDSIGGAIANFNDDNVIQNCTITGNSAFYRGGGIYNGQIYDITLKDKVIIKNNICANENRPDDLFLAYLDSTTSSYVIGAPGAGSEVGICTSAKEDRMVGEDAVFDESVFFSDVEGFYMHYDSSEKELYVVKKDNCSYPVTVNGKLQGYYNDTAKLTIEDSSVPEGKVFKQWTGDVSALDSASNKAAVVSMKDRKALTFTSEYITPASTFTLTVAKPAAGKELPTTATLSWAGDGDANAEKSLTVPVYWLTQNGDTTQTVAGKADYATGYCVATQINEDKSKDLLFGNNVTGKVFYTEADGTGADGTGTDGKDQTNKVYIGSDRTLYMYGNLIETEKAPIASVEDAYVSIVKDSDIDALKEKLPKTATVYDAQENEYTVNLDTANADFKGIADISDIKDLKGDTKVKNSGGTVTIPLALDGTEKIVNGTGENEKSLTVNVAVYSDGILTAPTADQASGTTYAKRGTDGKVTQKITLLSSTDEAQEGAKISYRCYELGSAAETEKGEFSESASSVSVTVSADKGEKKVYIIEAKSVNVAGKDDSTIATFTYTLDNPYIVTIDKTVKASKAENDYSLGTYKAKYYKGDTVTVGAAVVSGYVFDKWDTAKATGLGDDVKYDETDNIINAGSITDDINVTALYAPVLSVDSLNITLTAPKANESLAKNVSKVSAVVSGKGADGKTQSQTLDMTEYIKNQTVTWSPEASGGNDGNDGKADYSTVYTAKLALPTDTTTVKFASLGQIVVNDEITSIVKEEDGNYVVYATFPMTESAPLKTPTVTAPTAKTDLTSTGEDQELVNDGSAVGGTIVYSLEKEGKYDEEIPVGNAAGEYTVWYKALGDKGYEDTEPQSLSVVIGEAKTEPDPTPTPTPTPDTDTDTTPDTDSDKTPDTSSNDYTKCAQSDTCPIAKFSDSDPKAWYHDGVHYCLDKDYMNGVSAAEFAPNANMTRAQLVTILWRMDGQKVVNYAMMFSDVAADSWYTEAVRWAASEGIVTGYTDGKFGSSDAITREQLATILWRYAKYKDTDVSASKDASAGTNVSASEDASAVTNVYASEDTSASTNISTSEGTSSSENANISDYNDYKDISSYAVSAMQWALEKGIINGTGDSILKPLGTATRAQTAAMIQRFCK